MKRVNALVISIVIGTACFHSNAESSNSDKETLSNIQLNVLSAALLDSYSIATFIGMPALTHEFVISGSRWYGPSESISLDGDSTCEGLDLAFYDIGESEQLSSLFCDGEITRREVRNLLRTLGDQKNSSNRLPTVENEDDSIIYANEIAVFMSIGGRETLQIIVYRGNVYSHEVGEWHIQPPNNPLNSLASKIAFFVELGQRTIETDIVDEEEFERTKARLDSMNIGRRITSNRKFNGARYSGVAYSISDLIQIAPDDVAIYSEFLEREQQIQTFNIWEPRNECEGPSFVETLYFGIPMQIAVYDLCNDTI
ncbi:MAG: hypothetical protein GKR91_05955 [Pseudomonadales bacterium]|nr:hypothetical protein [Pseudomonadales bacterium]